MDFWENTTRNARFSKKLLARSTFAGANKIIKAEIQNTRHTLLTTTTYCVRVGL
jgi:hypothetical protein